MAYTPFRLVLPEQRQLPAEVLMRRLTRRMNPNECWACSNGMNRHVETRGYVCGGQALSRRRNAQRLNDANIVASRLTRCSAAGGKPCIRPCRVGPGSGEANTPVLTGSSRA